MGGDGQPSGGSQATGLRARAVYDYQAGMCNVKCLCLLPICALCMLRIFKPGTPICGRRAPGFLVLLLCVCVCLSVCPSLRL